MRLAMFKNNTVGFVLSALFILACIALSSASPSQQVAQTPKIPAQNETHGANKAEAGGGGSESNESKTATTIIEAQSDKKSGVSEDHRQNRGDETSEFWAIFGHRLKITDSLLVGFTFLLFVATLGLWLATRNLVRDARETSNKQLRASLSLKPSNMVFIGDVPMEINLTIENHGETPASRIVFQNAVHFPEYPLPVGYNPGDPVEGDSTEGLWPSEKHQARRELGRAIAPEILRQLRVGQRRVVAFGHVRYKDVFGETHFTKLCASFDWRQMATAKRTRDAATGHDTFDFEWQFELQHNDFD